MTKNSSSKVGRPALYANPAILTHIRTRFAGGESMRSIANDLRKNPGKVGLTAGPAYATIRAICNKTGGYAGL